MNPYTAAFERTLAEIWQAAVDADDNAQCPAYTSVASIIAWSRGRQFRQSHK